VRRKGRIGQDALYQNKQELGMRRKRRKEIIREDK
jgi:hypothetical protein